MSTVHPIDERHAFGHWLSGFTDGEGSFFLGLHRSETAQRRIQARFYFSIVLRADDHAILTKIKEFLGCGAIYFRSNYVRPSANTKPSYTFRVHRIADLKDFVIPQFRNYPLRAKKARDFVIWEQGVLLAERVASRKKEGRRDSRGVHAKWTQSELDQFQEMVELLRQQRRFNEQTLALPERQLPKPDLWAPFDTEA